MASYTASTAVHATTAENVADSITLTGSASYVTVFSHTRDKKAHVYFTVGDNPTTATVEGDNTFIATPGLPWTVKFDGTNTKVSLISEDVVEYSVIAHQGL